MHPQDSSSEHRAFSKNCKKSLCDFLKFVLFVCSLVSFKLVILVVDVIIVGWVSWVSCLSKVWRETSFSIISSFIFKDSVSMVNFPASTFTTLTQYSTGMTLVSELKSFTVFICLRCSKPGIRKPSLSIRELRLENKLIPCFSTPSRNWVTDSFLSK